MSSLLAARAFRLSLGATGIRHGLGVIRPHEAGAVASGSATTHCQTDHLFRTHPPTRCAQVGHDSCLGMREGKGLVTLVAGGRWDGGTGGGDAGVGLGRRTAGGEGVTRTGTEDAQGSRGRTASGCGRGPGPRGAPAPPARSVPMLSSWAIDRPSSSICMERGWVGGGCQWWGRVGAGAETVHAPRRPRLPPRRRAAHTAMWHAPTISTTPPTPRATPQLPRLPAQIPVPIVPVQIEKSAARPPIIQ